jgi:SAM-dependent methyltransferase
VHAAEVSSLKKANMLGNFREYKMMASVEEEHWWYRTLHRKVIDVITKSFFDKNVRVFDAGCGTGGFLKKLTLIGYKQVSGFDLSETAVGICIKRGLNVSQGGLADIRAIGGFSEYDVVTCLDALCYLTPSQRVNFFSDVYQLLSPGGLLITNQAALTIFRGTHDQVLGVSHRFDRKNFEDLYSQTGFELNECYYWPVSLSPIIFTSRLFQRINARTVSSSNGISDLRVYPKWINLTLFKLLQLEDRFPRMRFFGSSLFVVLRRPLSEARDLSKINETRLI